MSRSTRLLFNLLLPLLLGGGSLVPLYLLTEHLGGGTAAQLGAGLIALLLALLPVAAYRLLLLSQIQEGFALLNNGKIYLPGELPLSAVFGERITQWIPYVHTLQTTVCLRDEQQLLHVKIAVILTLIPDESGKKLAENLDTSLKELERRVQEGIYRTSQMDPEMVRSLDGTVLLNEADEAVLKSKFLSALEMVPIEGVNFPLHADGIHINRNVRRQAIKPAAEDDASQSSDWPDDDDLMLDNETLEQLGLL